tara:strand:+ start:425 stop:655 length:231 start_codon:yes stop_codon:yes gene_type:complete
MQCFRKKEGRVETKPKIEQENFLRHKFSEETSKRINLNDLLHRSREEKAKIKRTNVLVFSGVLFSALLVVIIMSYL